MKTFGYLLLACSLLTSGIWLPRAAAQERRGTISGTVTDSSHAVLPGAKVDLKPKGNSTVSSQTGVFTISNLDPGSYTLTISYVGLESYTKEVTVSSGATLTLAAELKIGTTNQSITVTSPRLSGEAAAINEERSADNIREVLPANVITSLPNTNIADALGRLPDVSLERDEGEGKYVQIRGTEPRLTNVTVNGINLPSPESGVRNIKLDVIPSDIVESIEVSKTLSANQDGDAIGGSVNLVTKTASDTPTVSLYGLGGITPIAGGRGMDTFSATVGERFGAEKKLGVLIGGTYDYNGRGIYDVEPYPAVSGGEDLRNYLYNRSRWGLNGGVDYRLGNGSSIYVKGLYSDFKDYGRRWVYSPNAGSPISPTQFDATGQETSNASIRRPDYFVSSVNVGGHQNIGAFLLDYDFAVSRSGQDGADPQTDFNGPSNVQYGLDVSNPNRPKFPVLNGVNVYDPSQFTLADTETLGYSTRQQNYAGRFDLSRNYTFGNHFGTIQGGVKIRDAHKVNNSNNQYYDATATIPMSNFVDGFNDPNYYDGSYTIGPLVNYSKIQNYFKANPSQFALNVDTTHQRNDPNNYDTSERVYAEYLMNTLDFGKLRLQTGLRIETTDSAFTGYKVNFDTNGHYVSTVPQPGSSNYTNLLPSVQLQYALSSNTVLRAAYGMGIARPNFGDLPPYLVLNDRRQSVSAGNPTLKPTKANNFDLLAEHYFRPLGVISAGYFFKSLENPIYSVTTTLSSGTYNGYQQTQPVNGSHAHIGGFETAWQQQLTFLPGYWNGLGVLANYSYTYSQARVPGRSDLPALIRQGPNNWNVGLTYDKGRLSYRFAVSHNDAYIYSYNYQDGADGGLKGPNGDQYLYAHTQVDMQGSWRLDHGFTFIAAILNVNNEVFGFYQGSETYPVQREYYHPTYEFGFRWNPIFERTK